MIRWLCVVVSFPPDQNTSRAAFHEDREGVVDGYYHLNGCRISLFNVA